MKCYLDLNWVRIRKCLAYNVSSSSLACGKELVGKGASIKAIAFREVDALQHLALGKMKNAENALTWKHGRVQTLAAAVLQLF